MRAKAKTTVQRQNITSETFKEGDRRAAENEKSYDGRDTTGYRTGAEIIATRTPVVRYATRVQPRFPERFIRCAVSPRAAKRMTQGKIALSRPQHQLRPRIARPTRRGSPFSANVKKLTRSIYCSLSLSLYFFFSLFLATPPRDNKSTLCDRVSEIKIPLLHVSSLDLSACHIHILFCHSPRNRAELNRMRIFWKEETRSNNRMK